MKVVVFHKEHYDAFDDTYNPEAKMVRVAVVDAPEELSEIDALEYAYRWTNNIAGSWSKGPISFGEPNGDYNERVEFVGTPHPEGYGHRSTSMGDVMYANGSKFVVAMMGFDRVDEEEAA